MLVIEDRCGHGNSVLHILGDLPVFRFVRYNFTAVYWVRYGMGSSFGRLFLALSSIFTLYVG